MLRPNAGTNIEFRRSFPRWYRQKPRLSRDKPITRRTGGLIVMCMLFGWEAQPFRKYTIGCLVESNGHLVSIL